MANKRSKAYQDRIDTKVSVRRHQVAKLLLSGVQSHADIAVRMGVTDDTIAIDVQAIRKGWIESNPEDIAEKSIQRIRQLEYIVTLCHASYKWSRKDKQVVTTVVKACDNPKCYHGLIKNEATQVNSVCPMCKGEGTVTTETEQLTGQAGDARWLSVARECIMDCARLEGTIQQALSTVRRTAERILEPGGQVRERIEELYINAPDDKLIEALSILDEIRLQSEEQRKLSHRVSNKGHQSIKKAAMPTVIEGALNDRKTAEVPKPPKPGIEPIEGAGSGS